MMGSALLERAQLVLSGEMSDTRAFAGVKNNVYPFPRAVNFTCGSV